VTHSKYAGSTTQQEELIDDMKMIQDYLGFKASEYIPPPTLALLQALVKEVNQLNGWFDDPRPFAADVALLHSEVSEMYEGHRNGDHVNRAEEAADILIRLLDTCER
jgi:hypothetical protein